MSVLRYALGTATNSVTLGNSAEDSVSSWVIQVTGTIGTGVISVQGFVGGPVTPMKGHATTALSSSDAVDVAYYVGTTGALTSGATDISALGIYRIIADGMFIHLAYTAGGGSDLVVHATPVRG